MIRQPAETTDSLTEYFPAFGQACWDLLRISWAWNHPYLEGETLAKAGFVKRICSYYQILPLGEKYLQHVRSSRLEDMWVEGQLVEALSQVILPLFKEGTLPNNFPWIEELKYFNLLEMKDNGQWGLSSKGSQWFFCTFGPYPLINILKLTAPKAWHVGGTIKVPSNTLESLARTIPYSDWAAIFCSLPNHLPGAEELVAELKDLIKKVRASKKA